MHNLGGWKALCGQVFKWAKKMHKHEDSCKQCVALELQKNQKLSELRVKAIGQGLECKKKLIVKKEKKGNEHFFLISILNICGY